MVHSVYMLTDGRSRKLMDKLIDNCDFMFVLLVFVSTLTMKAEAGMTIQGQCWGQFTSSHCWKPLVCERCVYL